MALAEYHTSRSSAVGIPCALRRSYRGSRARFAIRVVYTRLGRSFEELLARVRSASGGSLTRSPRQAKGGLARPAPLEHDRYVGHLWCGLGRPRPTAWATIRKPNCSRVVESQSTTHISTTFQSRPTVANGSKPDCVIATDSSIFKKPVNGAFIWVSTEITIPGTRARCS